MGELLRRFWMPALLEREIPEPDSPPVKVRILGEDLVAFKDTDGRVGILDNFCPHRLAPMHLGRNEKCGLTCIYHGWKFDVEGNCVDMPNETPEKEFSSKVRMKAYPSVIRGGVIWVYMGPEEKISKPPELEWSRLPEGQCYATKRLQQNNWAQAVEGGIDSSHISFLHSRNMDKQPDADKKIPINKYHQDGHPVVHVEETDYGMRIGGRRKAEEDSYYWRFTQFLVPFYTMIAPVGNFEDSRNEPYNGHAWVPIDDENTWTWSFGANPHRAYTEQELSDLGGDEGMWGPVDDNFRPVHNMDNNYHQDRELQKEGNYSGIQGIPNQDAAVQEGMGPIVDRTKEHLGSADLAIINFRKRLIQMAKDLADGKEPEAANQGNWYNIRSVAIVLDKEADVDEGAGDLFAGGEIRSAAE
ncbi:MAG: aromatic ring-hydroxylating dioxygenase subunit alpha [Rhodospirillaceae bacterium]|nr:aromatic ring-hydroxylating dioxygenase subunit alpha [Rhodospirillaceae bacterium]MBT4938507.1 aromatic ring-hydroxylating dioxygenase subunit alpha [Rhodospirillaceae bacterium]MBT7268721.1 aromatic ring-hydroxylating dioxygenase subunit alpha [Rhodospirillaceae bacterium]